MVTVSRWRTASKAGALGAASAMLFAALTFGLPLAFVVLQALIRNDSSRLETLVEEEGTYLIFALILGLVRIVPISVCVSIVGGLMLRRQIVCGQLPCARVAGRGALAGLGVAFLFLVVNMFLHGRPRSAGYFPSAWDMDRLGQLAVDLAKVGPVGACLGAWHGWRMRRWFAKRVVAVGSARGAVRGALIGVATGPLVFVLALVVWPQRWGIAAEIYLLGVAASCVGAWLGWLVGRRLRKRIPAA